MSTQARSVSQALEKLLPAKLPPSLANRTGNLYEVLSRTPASVTGRKIYQTRWSRKGIEKCWWEVTRAQFKLEGKHGKAWGKLYWKGQLINETETRIRGALKYSWAEGVSQKPTQTT